MLGVGTGSYPFRLDFHSTDMGHHMQVSTHGYFGPVFWQSGSEDGWINWHAGGVARLHLPNIWLHVVCVYIYIYIYIYMILFVDTCLLVLPHVSTLGAFLLRLGLGVFPSALIYARLKAGEDDIRSESYPARKLRRTHNSPMSLNMLTRQVKVLFQESTSCFWNTFTFKH